MARAWRRVGEAHEGERHDVLGFVKACRGGEFPMRAALMRGATIKRRCAIYSRASASRSLKAHPLHRTAVRLLLEKPTRQPRRVVGDFRGNGFCDVTWPSRQLSVVIERKRAMDLSRRQGPLSPGRVVRFLFPGPLAATCSTPSRCGDACGRALVGSIRVRLRAPLVCPARRHRGIGGHSCGRPDVLPAGASPAVIYNISDAPRAAWPYQTAWTEVARIRGPVSVPAMIPMGISVDAVRDRALGQFLPQLDGGPFNPAEPHTPSGTRVPQPPEMGRRSARKEARCHRCYR
jgi:hypothetical protein